MRPWKPVLLATVAAVALLAGSASAAPQISIDSPAAGASISRSATPTLSISGLVSFDEPRQEARTLYLRRTQCANGNDDAHLSPVKPNSSQQSGCLFIAQPANEVYATLGEEPLSTTYATEDFSFTLDASKPITGNVRLTSGYGQGTTQIRLTAMAGNQEVLLGTDSKSYTVSGGATNVAWSVQPPASEDKKLFSSISLNVLVRGVNVLHGAVDHRSGVSNFVLPTWNPTPSKKVEFALDSPTFPASAVKTATLGADGLSWSGSVLTPAVGNHTLYARAVQGSAVTQATPVAFTVTA